MPWFSFSPDPLAAFRSVSRRNRCAAAFSVVPEML